MHPLVYLCIFMYLDDKLNPARPIHVHTRAAPPHIHINEYPPFGARTPPSSTGELANYQTIDVVDCLWLLWF